MHILILGATGLIGSHLATALRNTDGYTVTCASRRRPANAAPADTWRAIDFSSMTDATAWLPHLTGIDAVVNCVGILREARAGDFDRLHRAAPVALFAACEQLGIARVLHVSALGSHVDAATGYWRSKGAAEADLMQRNLDATIVRASLVHGDDAASTQLFLMLATLPVLMMPVANQAKVQPVHIDDLVQALIKLLAPQQPRLPAIAAVGPEPLTMAAYLAALRSGLGAPAGKVFDLPLPVAIVVARVAALHPASALTPDSLVMLVDSINGGNTADAAPMAGLLGRPLRRPASFARPGQRAGAALAWGAPLMWLALAMLSAMTLYVACYGWPQQDRAAWLALSGLPLLAAILVMWRAGTGK